MATAKKKKATGHGGARPGAGRPPKIDDALRVHVSLPKALVEWLDERAGKRSRKEDAAFSRSDLVRELLEAARKKS
jgi:hypothetical protein